jgi:hypothetical protein
MILLEVLQQKECQIVPKTKQGLSPHETAYMKMESLAANSLRSTRPKITWCAVRI